MRLTLTSEAKDLFAFDFASGAPVEPHRRAVRLASSSGASNGVVQGIKLQLDEHKVYEDRSGPGAKPHWAALFHPFREGRRLDPGRSVAIRAAHDLERLQIGFS